jgi:hypothetical protein
MRVIKYPIAQEKLLGDIAITDGISDYDAFLHIKEGRTKAKTPVKTTFTFTTFVKL